MSVFYPQAKAVIYLVLQHGGSRDEPLAFQLTPLSVSVVRNSYAQADSWSAEFDHAQLPVTPEIIRSAAIEIGVFAGRSLSDAPGPDDTEPAIAGLVDHVEVQYSSAGRIVRLEGQDYTALFQGKSWRADKKGRPDPIPVGKRLDVLIEQLLREVDTTGRIQLDRSRLPADIPVLKDTNAIVRRGFSADSKATYWSVMSKIAQIHGCILYMRGRHLVLATPVSVQERSTRKYQLQWGRNLTDLRLARSMGKETVPQIVIKAYDIKAKKTVTVKYPTEKQKTKTGLGTARDEQQIHEIYGVTDRRVMAQFARNLYEARGRGEQTVSFATADLEDAQGLSLLEMQSGDTVFLDFEQEVVEDMRQMQAGQRLGYLQRLGFHPRVAQFISDNYGLLPLQRALYFRGGTISYSVTGGLSIQGEAINYITPEGIHA